MPASKNTVLQVVQILKEEVGLEKGLTIARRLSNETHGNTSYMITVGTLVDVLETEVKRAHSRKLHGPNCHCKNCKGGS